ncbi:PLASMODESMATA CALLOSE-BINDING PROTEIN 2-like [Typha angustifolia]|uniref:PLASMODESMATA CALLOSE-BINDING PROTEIN 2-like n=1 Tax=Typha angustifolia TaxID=59011 RepID=UPI003C2F62DF
MGAPSVRSPIPPSLPLPLLILLLLFFSWATRGDGAMWCIAQSGANVSALQAAIDYACGAGGADCAPITASGLCYLPNTLAAHASYAFNSYYQRSNAAPGACDFAGTAAVSLTDPSYGSCTYPSSKSTAGGTTGTANGNTPTTTTDTPGFSGTGGGLGGLSPPGFGSTVPNLDSSGSSLLISLKLVACLCYLLAFS